MSVISVRLDPSCKATPGEKFTDVELKLFKAERDPLTRETKLTSGCLKTQDLNLKQSSCELKTSEIGTLVLQLSYTLNTQRLHYIKKRDEVYGCLTSKNATRYSVSIALDREKGKFPTPVITLLSGGIDKLLDLNLETKS